MESGESARKQTTKKERWFFMSLYEKYLNRCQRHEDMTVTERAAIISSI